MKNVYILVLLTLVSFVSCSKDDDEENDNVTITLTSEDYLQYDVPFNSDSIAHGYFDGAMYYRISSEIDKTIEVARGSDNATDVNIPRNVIINGNKYVVTSIGYAAFFECGLVSVTIPNSVMTIGNGAFGKCGSLRKVKMEAVIPPEIGVLVFYYTGSPIYVPTNSVEAYKTAWKEWADRILDVASISDEEDGETVYTEKGEYLYRPYWGSWMDWETSLWREGAYDGVSYYNCNEDGIAFVEWVSEDAVNVNIPKYVVFEGGKYMVTEIGMRAFASCDSLRSVSIPNSITCIKSSTFSEHKLLNSVTIPEGVTKIEDIAFRDCSSLASITLPSTITGIGSSTFDGCSLMDIYVKCQNPPKMHSRSYGGDNGYGGHVSITPSFSTQTFNNATLHVSKGLKAIYAYDKDWGSFVHIEEMQE